MSSQLIKQNFQSKGFSYDAVSQVYRYSLRRSIIIGGYYMDRFHTSLPEIARAMKLVDGGKHTAIAKAESFGNCDMSAEQYKRELVKTGVLEEDS